MTASYGFQPFSIDLRRSCRAGLPNIRHMQPCALISASMCVIRSSRDLSESRILISRHGALLGDAIHWVPAAISNEYLNHSVDHPRFDHLQRPGRGRGFRFPRPRVEKPLVERALDVSPVEVAVAQIRPSMGAAGKADEDSIGRVVYGEFPAAAADWRRVSRLKLGDQNQVLPRFLPSQGVSFGRSSARGEMPMICEMMSIWAPRYPRFST